MLLDLRVLMMSSSAAFSYCLVRFSDILWRPKPSLWKEPSGSASGLSELQFMRKKGEREKQRQKYYNVAMRQGHSKSRPFNLMTIQLKTYFVIIYFTLQLYYILIIRLGDKMYLLIFIQPKTSGPNTPLLSDNDHQLQYTHTHTHTHTHTVSFNPSF